MWGDTEKFGQAAKMIMLGNRRDIESIEVEREKFRYIRKYGGAFHNKEDEIIIAELDEFMLTGKINLTAIQLD